MKDTKKVVVGLVKNGEGKYLLIKPDPKYKDFGDMRDAWYPPSGHVKENETLKEALTREIEEELGVGILEANIISDWPQDVPGETGFWWNVAIKDTKIKTNKEILEWKYFSKEEIKDLKLWPAERKFFEKFIWK